MTIRRTALAALAAAVPFAFAGAASAAPARDHTFKGPAETFSWTTGQFVGVVEFSDGTVPVEECSPGRDCEDTLLKLERPGVLTASNVGQSAGMQDVALDLYTSDASGTQGEVVKKHDANLPAKDESVSAELDPGFYLVRVDFLLGAGTVDVDAKFEPLALGPIEVPAVTPPAVTPPTAAPNALPDSTVAVKKKVKAKSLKSLAGKATDSDGAIAKVEIAVLRLKGDDCKALTGRGSLGATDDCEEPANDAFLAAKGTSKWSFKLKKRLPKGKYVVFVRATDDKGGVQAELTERAFTVS